MSFPTVFVSIALILTVSGLVQVLRYRMMRGGILIVAGLVVGLVSGNYLD